MAHGIRTHTFSDMCKVKPMPPRPVMLMILDGWGWREDAQSNAIKLAKTPYFDRFWASCPHSFLRTSGLDVGLPAGQMGNSEVGHLNLGAGRVVMQDLPRINQAISDGRRLAGMEHWLPLFEERLETLFEHLPGDAILIRDAGDAGGGYAAQRRKRIDVGHDVERDVALLAGLVDHHAHRVRLARHRQRPLGDLGERDGLALGLGLRGYPEQLLRQQWLDLQTGRRLAAELDGEVDPVVEQHLDQVA